VALSVSVVVIAAPVDVLVAATLGAAEADAATVVTCAAKTGEATFAFGAVTA